MPELFRSLRGLIDRGRREGKGSGRFLLLGSASMDLMQQSSESLAGRISYLELAPIDVSEIGKLNEAELWSRGGFPNSFLANSDEQSLRWRLDFIRTYLQRDIPELGPRIPSETLRRFWTMLAHLQGGIVNIAQIAGSLGVSGKTAATYLDLMVDLLLVRRLSPWRGNSRKRLIKSPKVYVRDSGLVHALLGLGNEEAILGHPVAGSSWEGFVIESLSAAVPDGTALSFYRTSAGAEVDLILDLPAGRRWIVEVKRGLNPRPERGFYSAYEELRPDRAFIAYAGSERYKLADAVEAIGVRELSSMLLAQ
jgi:predicted AAA+ superfamily ATPase